MAIINLRGTNGSGKSTAIRGLLTNYGQPKTVTLIDAPRPVLGQHVERLGLIVVGSYENTCGGCDGIPTQALVDEAVTIAATLTPNVVFEGIIVSTIFNSWLRWSQQRVKAKQEPLTWAFLDTPVELCVERVRERNNDTDFAVNLVWDKYRSIERCHIRAKMMGERVVVIDHRKPVGVLIDLLDNIS